MIDKKMPTSILPCRFEYSVKFAMMEAIRSHASGYVHTIVVLPMIEKGSVGKRNQGNCASELSFTR